MITRAARLLGGVALTGGLVYAGAFWARSQVCGPFPYRGDTRRRVVALTFDDGPNEPYTSQLLGVLAQRGVRATFFCVGRCVERYPDTARRIVAEGHVIGNHSYSHAFHRYLTQPRQRDEIDRAEAVIVDRTGVRPALYRPPWLCHFPWVLGSVRHRDLQVVSGLFAHPAEVFQPPAARMTAAAERLAAPGTMIIFHDGVEARGGRRDQSVAAVGPLIDRLRERGYGFATVDELLGVRPTLATPAA